MKTNFESIIKSWGVYYVPTREGRLFANLKSELMGDFEDQIKAIEYCENLNMTGYIDELHSGYTVKPIYK